MRPDLLLVLAVLAAAPARQPPPAPIPAPVPLSRAGLKPMAPGQSLIGLPVVGDAAAQCRTTCARARTTCGADERCTDNWVQCVATCR